jgi:Spy/CpxP family protein refolding chaperone
MSAGFWINRTSALKSRPVRGYLDLISLSAEQKQKVELIRKDFFPKLDHIRRELQIKRLQLNDLIFAAEPDLKAIEIKASEIAGLQTELEKEVIDHILQEKELLTEDQQKQFHMILRTEFEKSGLWMHGEKKPGSGV